MEEGYMLRQKEAKISTSNQAPRSKKYFKKYYCQASVYNY